MTMKKIKYILATVLITTIMLLSNKCIPIYKYISIDKITNDTTYYNKVRSIQPYVYYRYDNYYQPYYYRSYYDRYYTRLYYTPIQSKPIVQPRRNTPTNRRLNKN